MKQLAYAAAVLLALAAAQPMPGQTRPAVALEGAINREQVDGDLAAAIATYQKIAANTAAPREVRAKALLHLAASYEKLGKLSQGVYQQIVREFGDQPAAVQARARLAAFRESQAPVPASMTQRKIEIPGSFLTPQITDGRRMVYRNDAAGELIYSDLVTKSSRVIFKGEPGDVPEWMPSRDFSMVALYFRKKANRVASIALIQSDGQGYRELLRDDEQGSVFGESGGMMNWSWDNRYLLVNHHSVRETRRVLVVSTGTGERSLLIAQEDGFFQKCAFSPDGRFVACKLSPDPGASESRIFLVAAHGGELSLVRAEPDPNLKLLDWTDDGRYLAIASAYTGRSALHLLPVKDGHAAGEPVLIQAGAFEDAFTTRGGALINLKLKPGGLWTLHVANLGGEMRVGAWEKLEHYGENSTNPWPHWSPDSNQLVYTARDPEGEFGNAAVRVRSFATGGDREIYRTPGHMVCVWGATRARIFCSQWKDSTTILSIEPDSGQVDRIGGIPAAMALVYRAGADDRSLHFWKIEKDNVTTSRWEISSGQETKLDGSGNTQTASRATPDERRLVLANRREIAVKPLGGSRWQTLAATTNLQFAITPDGNWVLYHATDSAGGHALYRVPVAGGTPERLGSFPSAASLGSIEVSPDGRRIVTASYDYAHGFEVWALDHFVPAAGKR